MDKAEINVAVLAACQALPFTNNSNKALAALPVSGRVVGGALSIRARAISLVLAGGLVGSIVSPEVGKLTVEALATRYLGATFSLIGFLVLVIGVLQLLDMPSPAGDERRARGRCPGP